MSWDETRQELKLKKKNISEIYYSVKFHQMAINQKLNLSDDTIFIVSRRSSGMTRSSWKTVTETKSFKRHKNEERREKLIALRLNSKIE